MFIFKKGYICCGCMKRFGANHAHVTYKKSCICKECYDKLEFTNKSSVFSGTRETAFVAAPFLYQSLYRDMFLKFKFYGDFAVGHLLGMLMEEYFKDVSLIADFDCIVPVPLSKRRLRERGYNQTDILADYISKALSIPVNNALVRQKHCEAQSISISRAENVKGAFRATKDMNGLNVLIFDDILTTGSTVNECARVLKLAGADKIGTVCGAYVVRPEEKYGYI